MTWRNAKDFKLCVHVNANLRAAVYPSNLVLIQDNVAAALAGHILINAHSGHVTNKLRHLLSIHARAHIYAYTLVCVCAIIAYVPRPPAYKNVWPEADVVVLHVKQCLQTCSFSIFIITSNYINIKSFSFRTVSICQLCAQICPYRNVLLEAVYCCLNKNYNVYKILSMTLHTGLTIPTSLQNFMV